MKTILFITFCLIAQVYSQGPGFNTCPEPAKDAKKADLPAVGKFYQIIRENKIDAATCYNIDIKTTKDKAMVNITQSLVMQTIVLQHSYMTTPALQGYLNVTLDSKFDKLLVC